MFLTKAEIVISVMFQSSFYSLFVGAMRLELILSEWKYCFGVQ